MSGFSYVYLRATLKRRKGVSVKSSNVIHYILFTIIDLSLGQWTVLSPRAVTEGSRCSLVFQEI